MNRERLARTLIFRCKSWLSKALRRWVYTAPFGVVPYLSRPATRIARTHPFGIRATLTLMLDAVLNNGYLNTIMMFIIGIFLVLSMMTVPASNIVAGIS